MHVRRLALMIVLAGAASASPPREDRVDLDALAPRIAQVLSLDEAQRAAFLEISASYRETLQAIWTRQDALRIAHEDDQAEQAAKLEQELAELGDQNSVVEAIYDELAPHLRDDQYERLDLMRTEQQELRSEREAMQMIREMPVRLGLNDEQRELFHEQASDFRTQLGAERAQVMEARAALQKAVAAGDRQAADAARQTLTARRAAADAVMERFFADVHVMLSDEQRAVLGDLQARLDFVGGATASAAGVADVRTVLRAARRVELRAEQRSKLREIERSAMREHRNARRGEAARRLAEGVRAQVAQMLDAEQRAGFEAALKRLSPRR